MTIPKQNKLGSSMTAKAGDGYYATLSMPSLTLIFIALGIGRNSRLLDFGCGLQRPGVWALLAFGVAMVIGVDINALMLTKTHSMLARLFYNNQYLLTRRQYAIRCCNALISHILTLHVPVRVLPCCSQHD